MDTKILELATEITRQAMTTEKNGLSLRDEAVEFLERIAKKLAELEQASANDSGFGLQGEEREFRRADSDPAMKFGRDR